MANYKEGYKRVEMRVNLKTYERIKNIADMWTNGNVTEMMHRLIWETRIINMKPLQEMNLHIGRISSGLNEISKKIQQGTVQTYHFSELEAEYKILREEFQAFARELLQMERARYEK